jgi:hypothetical protein
MLKIPQGKMMKKTPDSNRAKKYKEFQERLHELPWLVNGSVMKIAPRSDSPTARTTYTWTRKIKAKTVTVALSKEQYLAFRKAIEANRRVEKTLTQMRKLSERVLLESLPGVKKKPRKPPAQK